MPFFDTYAELLEREVLDVRLLRCQSDGALDAAPVAIGNADEAAIRYLAGLQSLLVWHNEAVDR